jgi:flagellar biogenesis protein FliO
MKDFFIRQYEKILFGLSLFVALGIIAYFAWGVKIVATNFGKTTSSPQQNQGQANFDLKAAEQAGIQPNY